MFLKHLSFQFLLCLRFLGLRLGAPAPALTLLFLGVSFTAPRISTGRGAQQGPACVTSTWLDPPHPWNAQCRGWGRLHPSRYSGWGSLELISRDTASRR